MIHVDRSRVSLPPELHTRAQVAYQKIAAGFANDGVLIFDDSVWRSMRASLMELFQNKCAYCESPIGDSSRGQIEHFRPKANALNSDGSRSREHYWWLAYDWSNLLIACMACSVFKSNRFPTLSSRAAPRTFGLDLLAEGPLLLDPCFDQPDEHLVFDESGRCAGLTGRGQATIEVLSLNRADLVHARRRDQLYTEVYLLQMLKSAADGSFPMEEARKFVSPSEPYSAARRFVRQRLLKETQSSLLMDNLGEQGPGASPAVVERAIAAQDAEMQTRRGFSVESTAPEHIQAYFSGARRIERIEIRDFKAIAHLDLTFPTVSSERESWLMLLGENAAGKSSVLQALALALMGEAHANALKLDAWRFVRRGSNTHSGRVTVTVSNVGPIDLTFRQGSNRFTVNPPAPQVLLLGYGATRLLPRLAKRAASRTKYVRILNLFDPTAPLSDAEGWLSDATQVDDDRFADIAKGLRTVAHAARGSPHPTFGETRFPRSARFPQRIE